MPLWVIYHTPTAFNASGAKRALVESITNYYVSKVGLPAFYVVVQFVEQDPETSYFVGGQPASELPKPHIRLSIEHIAAALPNQDAAYLGLTNSIDALLKPHLEDQGYDWEYHIDETERRMWKINGLIPPPFRGEVESRWRQENKPSEWDGGRMKPEDLANGKELPKNVPSS